MGWSKKMVHRFFGTSRAGHQIFSIDHDANKGALFWQDKLQVFIGAVAEGADKGVRVEKPEADFHGVDTGLINAL
jgi:hypothetical protein